ncbi:uncharacterized protein [Halyomorpha halys]|uniref:uncharacterized protein isoform X2 n=1 Tax=Halyomorpha halys TaxID=286706 RepID=UPI0006D50445|nr:uncharacterized protein LOC106689897 isoform X2 [Halyomorpha halys]
MMLAGRIFLTKVIEMYRELPCLWNRADPHYNNKVKRDVALDQMLELFKEHDPNASKDTVQKKINTLRGCYRKELNKVRLSEISATSPDEIHVPKLWYYDLMLFLQEQEIPRQSKRAFPILDQKSFDDDEEVPGQSKSASYSILDQKPFGGDEEVPRRLKRVHPILDQKPFVDDEIACDEFGNDTPTSQSIGSTPEPSEGSIKRSRLKTEHVLQKVASKIDHTLQSPIVQMPWRQPHDAFGEHIAEKLRTIPLEQLPICQKLINDAIFYAEINALSVSSRIDPK